MASSARIDELQKKFAENPRRYFAPLADEYRKAGDHATAIEICRAHLAQQPGHMSGHIVLGKALYEAGSLDEAQGTFETALALDPENLIALRHLGDIAHQKGDPHTARSWYQRVLDADPRNEEIAAQLRELDAAGPAEPAAADIEGIDLNVELPADLAHAPDTLAQDTTPDGSLPSALEPSALAYLAEEPSPAAADRPSAGAGDFLIDEPADASAGRGSSELTFLDTSDDTEPAAAVAGDIGLESMEFVPPSGDDRSVAGTDGLLERAYDFEPPPAARGADAFATETMAELYLQQGHADRALEVYQQLLAARPDDEALRARVARLQHEVAPDAAAAAGIDASAYAGERAPRGAAGTGRSAREFFGALAGRRPRGGTGAAHARADVGDRGDDTFASFGGVDAAEERLETVGGFGDVSVSADDMAGADLDAGAYAALSHEDAAEHGGSLGGEPATYEASAYDVTAFEEATFDAAGSGFGAADEGYAPPAVAPLGGDEFTLADEADAAPSYRDVPDTLAEDTTPDGTLPPSLEPSALAYLADETSELDAGLAPPAVTPPRSTTPAGGVTGTLDALFAGAGAGADDEAAAAALASVFSGAPPARATGQAADAPAAPGGPAASPTNSPAVRPARNELSLDHVFRDTPRQNSSQRREASAFSFDQFFSDAPGAGQEPAAPEPPPEATGDIEQFTAWLEGLKKK